MFGATTFLNVDLDLASAEDLAPLVDALAPDVHALHVGRVGRRHRATLELRGQPRTPDSAIRRLVAAVRQLPPRQRARWNRATRRDFNVGIQAAATPRSREFAIDAATVAAVGGVGGRIVVTVYGASLAGA
jgi:hypothetical protein